MKVPSNTFIFHIYYEEEIKDNLIVINTVMYWKRERALCPALGQSEMRNLQPVLNKLALQRVANGMYTCPRTDDINKIKKVLKEFGFGEDPEFSEYIDSTRAEGIEENHNDQEEKEREEFLKKFSLTKETINIRTSKVHGDQPIYVTIGGKAAVIDRVGKITVDGQSAIVLNATECEDLISDPIWIERFISARYSNTFSKSTDIQSIYVMDNGLKAFFRILEDEYTLILVKDGEVVESASAKEEMPRLTKHPSIGEALISDRPDSESMMMEEHIEEWAKAFATEGRIGSKLEGQKPSISIPWHDGRMIFKDGEIKKRPS